MDRLKKLELGMLEALDSNSPSQTSMPDPCSAVETLIPVQKTPPKRGWYFDWVITLQIMKSLA
jgi:hypothetical protein